jgi:hypothetical protein
MINSSRVPNTWIIRNVTDTECLYTPPIGSFETSTLMYAQHLLYKVLGEFDDCIEYIINGLDMYLDRHVYWNPLDNFTILGNTTFEYYMCTLGEMYEVSKIDLVNAKNAFQMHGIKAAFHIIDVRTMWHIICILITNNKYKDYLNDVGGASGRGPGRKPTTGKLRKSNKQPKIGNDVANTLRELLKIEIYNLDRGTQDSVPKPTLRNLYKYINEKAKDITTADIDKVIDDLSEADAWIRIPITYYNLIVIVNEYGRQKFNEFSTIEDIISEHNNRPNVVNAYLRLNSNSFGKYICDKITGNSNAIKQTLATFKDYAIVTPCIYDLIKHEIEQKHNTEFYFWNIPEHWTMLRVLIYNEFDEFPPTLERNAAELSPTVERNAAELSPTLERNTAAPASPIPFTFNFDDGLRTPIPNVAASLSVPDPTAAESPILSTFNFDEFLRTDSNAAASLPLPDSNAAASLPLPDSNAAASLPPPDSDAAELPTPPIPTLPADPYAAVFNIVGDFFK